MDSSPPLFLLRHRRLHRDVDVDARQSSSARDTPPDIQAAQGADHVVT